MKKALLLLITLLLIVTPVHAAPRIMQGETVYLNDTVDISGVTGWMANDGEYYAAYFGGGDYGSTTGTIIKLPPRAYKARPSQYEYYIDPAVFGSKLGLWHQYYPVSKDLTPEQHGYTVMFNVAASRSTNVTENQTAVVNNTPSFPYKPSVPTRHIADYVVMRGDNLTINTNQITKLWLLGRLDGIYDQQSVNNTIVITENRTRDMEPGRYDMLLQKMKPGLNVFTVRYNPTTQELESFHPETFTISKLPLYGLTPQVAKGRILEVFNNSMDGYEQLKFELQEPAIDITMIETLKETDTVALVDIRGYTNAANGTPIKFVFDEELQTPRTLASATHYTTTLGIVPGDMRYFQKSVPIHLYELFPGEHWITAYLPNGAYQRVPYFIWEAEKHYTPNATIRYIGGNEFVPTPTPQIINVTQTVVVTKVVTVTVPVPPPQSSVDAATWKTISTIVQYGILAVVAMILVCYGMSIVARAYMRKRKNDEQETKKGN